MTGIFISYRRDDQPGFAGRLTDALVGVFGADKVFRDVDDIYPGDDFVAVLDAQLRQIDAMLVIIGPEWLLADSHGHRRIDDSADFVRQEIRAGLAAGCPLFPILVAGASMPDESALPEDICLLARHQAATMSDLNWTTDLNRLLDVLTPILKQPNTFQRFFRTRWQVASRWSLLIACVIFVVAIIVSKKIPWSMTLFENDLRNQQVHAPLIEKQRLAGRWIAQVTYDWGAQHAENFSFVGENNRVHGTASYLSVARTIENAKFQGDYVTFTTHSQEIIGDEPPRTVTHNYRGTVHEGELQLTLESSGGHTEHVPIELTAVRSDN